MQYLETACQKYNEIDENKVEVRGKKMIEIITDTIFHLYNEKISYVMHVLPNRQLGHLYFGPSLGHLRCQ